MAKRRMFMENLIESDEFCALPHSAQALYFHLNMAADDDGLVGNPIRVTRSLCISKKNFEILVQSGFVILFDSGVLAITHWLSNNNIRKDRYTPTRFKNEMSLLKIKDGAMYIKAGETISADILPQKCTHNAPQVSIGKVSEVKGSQDEVSGDEGSQAELSEVEYSQDEYSRNEEREGEKRGAYSSFEREIEIKKEKEPPSEGSFENDKSFSVSLSKEENNEEFRRLRDKFISSVKLHIMTQYGTIDDKGFIDYYEKRGWLDDNYQPMVKNYKTHLTEWMKTH